MFHKHKYEKVEKDGYQYCSKCGKAILAPKQDCDHKWQRIDRVKISNILWGQNYIVGHKYVLECQKCGCIKSVDIT